MARRLLERKVMARTTKRPARPPRMLDAILAEVAFRATQAQRWDAEDREIDAATAYLDPEIVLDATDMLPAA